MYVCTYIHAHFNITLYMCVHIIRINIAEEIIIHFVLVRMWQSGILPELFWSRWWHSRSTVCRAGHDL